MRPFGYERATDDEGAVHAATLERPGGHAAYLGGGTNLVDLMRLGVERPVHLVDVTRLGHDEVEERADGSLRIGAGVRNSDLAAHPAVLRDHPLLAQALLAGASGQLRNLATVGGNLLQRTRCPYFQDTTKPCNKREPGSGCPAREGDHCNLAIIGHSQACVATHPSDMAVALVALGATVHVVGAAGARDVPLPGLHRLPGAEPHRDTVLEPGDLIVGVTLPPPVAGGVAHYRKVRERASYAFALVSAGVVLAVEDGVVRECRIALGGVAHAPWRARRAEGTLTGGPASAEAFARAADAELEQALPLRDNGYKVPLVRNVLVRTLTELAS
jgi:xanthine dehydrogenase YagS FAD-binding subunit